MHILFAAGRELSYSRNRSLVIAFQAQGRVTALGRRSGRARIAPQSLITSLAGLVPVLGGREEVLAVGFYGYLLMLTLGALSHRPVLFDAFISTYDTLCFDRRRFRPGSIPGRLAFWLDRTACRLADLVLLDTQAHANYFQSTFGVPASKIRLLPVGCNDEIFQPRPDLPVDPQEVLFYGSFLPTHGIAAILGSARLLQGSGVHYTIIGPQEQWEHLDRSGLDHVTFRPSLPEPELPAAIARAAVSLGGHFGATAKAGRVIAGKTYQCLAMGKPVIVGENPANHELLTHAQDAWFCAMDNPQALAEAVLALVNDAGLRQKLGENARQTYVKQASGPVLAERVGAILKELR